MKNDKIWGYQNEGVLLTRDCQNSNFKSFKLDGSNFQNRQVRRKDKIGQNSGVQNEEILLKQER